MSIQPPRLTLYSGPLSMFGAKAQIAALERHRMTQRPAVSTVSGAMAAWLKAAGRPVPAFMLAP